MGVSSIPNSALWDFQTAEGRKTYEVRFKVDNVFGIFEGFDDVRFRGVPAGTIEKIEQWEIAALHRDHRSRDGACARALALGTRSYSSVAAILKNAQDRKPREPDHPSLFHENIRGSGYYH